MLGFLAFIWAYSQSQYIYNFGQPPPSTGQDISIFCNNSRTKLDKLHYNQFYRKYDSIMSRYFIPYTPTGIFNISWETPPPPRQ